jgi:ribonucleoside-diphosphate reductase alpha chain
MIAALRSGAIIARAASHGEMSESRFDALGKDEGKAPANSNKYVSKGMTRSRTDNLVVMRPPAPADNSDARASGANVTSMAAAATTARHGSGDAAVAFKTPDHALSPTEKLEAQAWSEAGTAAAAAPSKTERRAEAKAKAKGYEGDMCRECSNFTLVRNGSA